MSLPESWRELRLGDICDLGSGDGAPQEDHWFAKNGEPFVRVSDLSTAREDSRIYSSRDKVTKSAIEQLRLRKWPKNSLIFPKSGASALLNQRALLGVDACVVSHLAILKPTELIDADFLYWWSTKFDAARVIPDPSYPSIRLQDLARLKIALPTLPEQKRIVDVLQQADALKNLKTEARKIFSSLAKQRFAEMFGHPAENSKGFETAPFQSFGTLDRGVSKHRPRDAGHLLGGPYPFIQTGDISNAGDWLTNYKATYSEAGLAQSRLWPRGTLCITIAANIAKAAILEFDACFPDSVVGFIPHDDVCSEYVLYCLRFYQEYFEHRAPQSAQMNINLDTLRKLRMPKPPKILQDEFSRFVYEMRELNQVDIEQADRFSHLVEELGVVAFTGELTANWRESNHELVRKAAVERETTLSERGTRVNLHTDPVIPAITKIEQPLQPARQWLFDELGEIQRHVLEAFTEYSKQSGQPLLVEDPEIFASFCDDSAVVERLQHFGESLGNRIRRTLSQLAALGLIAKVTLPKRNLETGELDYLKAFRPLRSDEYSRIADLQNIRNILSPVNYYFTAQLDHETSEHAGAGGMFQVISIEDDDEKDFTYLVDQGKHYGSLEELKIDIASALKVETHQVDLEAV